MDTLKKGVAEGSREDYLASARAQVVEDLVFVEFPESFNLLEELVHGMETLDMVQVVQFRHS